MFPPLQRRFFGQINVGPVSVDVGSTVLTREGGQEGSAKGCNSNRRGRNSHHPLMAFISQTRMVANAWLRPGKTAACSSCVEFMRETFDEALRGVKVGLVRGDSGFYIGEILSALEQRRDGDAARPRRISVNADTHVLNGVLASALERRNPLIFKVEPAVGIEPTTSGLQNRCSTAELCWHREGLPTLNVSFDSANGFPAKRWSAERSRPHSPVSSSSHSSMRRASLRLMPTLATAFMRSMKRMPLR